MFNKFLYVVVYQPHNIICVFDSQSSSSMLFVLLLLLLLIMLVLARKEEICLSGWQPLLVHQIHHMKVEPSL